MTFDSADGYVLLAGGLRLNGHATFDTWTYLGGTWSNISLWVGTTPPDRYGAAISDGPYDGYVVMFGGWLWGSSSYGADTWEFSAGIWTQLAPAASPPARGFAALAYDPSDNGTVLLGGYTTGVRGDTWLY